MKAWTQNLGHNDMLTTLTSYGSVPLHKQGELIRAQAIGSIDTSDPLDDPDIRALICKIKAKAK